MIGLVLVSAVCSSVFAEFYYGGQLGRITHSWNAQAEDNHFNSFGTRIGGYWDSRVAVEARLFFGANDETQPNALGGQTVNLHHVVAGYGRWDFATRSRLVPYAIAGYSQAEISDSTLYIAQRDRSVSGWSYGFGVELFYSPYGAVNVEWIQLVYGSTETLSMLQFGILGRLN